MAPLGTVVVVADSPTNAARAVDRALLLPLHDAASLHLLRVLPPKTPATGGDGEREAWLQLEELAQRARRESRRALAVEPRVLRGNEAVEGVRHARTAAADLIVCGRQGDRRVRTTTKMAREAELPLLVVASRVRGPYRRVVVAVDLSDASRDVAETALRVSKDAQQLHFVHSLHVPFDTRLDGGAKHEIHDRALDVLDHLLGSLGDVRARVTSRIGRAEAAPLLLVEAERVGADLIVVGTHGRGALGRALHGSVSRDVIADAPCDVLVARPMRVTYDLP